MRTFIYWLEDANYTDQITPEMRAYIIQLYKNNPNAANTTLARIAREKYPATSSSQVSDIIKRHKMENPGFNRQPPSEKFEIMNYIKNRGSEGLVKLGYALYVMGHAENYEDLNLGMIWNIMKTFTAKTFNPDEKKAYYRIGKTYEDNKGITPYGSIF